MSGLSFAKRPNAGSSGPASAPPEPPAADQPSDPTKNVTPAATDANVTTPPQNLPATRPATASSLGLYTGAEDEEQEVDAKDIKLPRLNLVQDMSSADLKKIGAVGDFVFKSAVKLPQPIRLVVAGFFPKKYAEKTKYGSDTKPRYANSLQEVYALGGTDEWRQSKENDKIDSRKPWFMPMVTGLILIQKPEGVDDDHFPIVTAEGVAYAAALFTVKSTSFGSFFVPIQSEKVSGVLRGGYNHRFIELTSVKGSKQAFEPRVRILDVTPQSVRDAANQAAGVSS